MYVKLLSITENSEKLIEYAARVCYNSQSKITEASFRHFIPKILKKHHEDVLEHASATFEIVGVSRALLAQLTRHRLCSFSVRSQRYCNEESAEFLIPLDIKKSLSNSNLYHDFLLDVKKLYKNLIANGIKKEDARMVLPQSTLTNLVMTANFRQLRHIFKLRCHKSAQWEIKEMARCMLTVMYTQTPTVFRDLYGQFILGEIDANCNVN